MKNPLTTVAIVLLIAASAGISGPRPQQRTAPACTAIMEQALAAYARIKVGTTRGEVEKYFVRAGGLQSAGKTFYDFPSCPYIHVVVYYTATWTPGQPYSPADKVTRVSKLYLGYQVRD
jgi:hypothetical protein